MLRTATFAPELVAYWHWLNAFPPNGPANYGFYIHAFRDVFFMFYPRSGFLSRLFGVLAICGFTNLLWSIQNARSRVLLALACLPIIALLVLNRFHLYPFYSEKQDVFIFPCLAAPCGTCKTCHARLSRLIRPDRLSLMIYAATPGDSD